VVRGVDVEFFDPTVVGKSNSTKSQDGTEYHSKRHKGSDTPLFVKIFFQCVQILLSQKCFNRHRCL
jgi:hypothetical protein